MMMMFPYMPQPAILEALGRVVVRHTYLDRMLRLTIKSLTGESLTESLARTKRNPSRRLRERVVEAAAKAGIAGDAVALLDSLLARAERASERRNQYVHSVYCWIYDGEKLPDDLGGADAALLTEDEHIATIPTQAELLALDGEIDSIANDLNNARRFGPIAMALREAKVSANARTGP